MLPKNYHPLQGSVLSGPTRLENIFLQRVQQNLLLLDPSISQGGIKLGMYSVPAGAQIAFVLEATEPGATCKLVEVKYHGNLVPTEFFVNSFMAHVRQLDQKLADALGRLGHSPAGEIERGSMGAAMQGFYVKIQSNILKNKIWVVTLADSSAHGIIAAMPKIAQQ